MKIVISIMLWVIIVLVVILAVKSIINTIKERTYRKKKTEETNENEIIDNKEKGE